MSHSGAPKAHFIAAGADPRPAVAVSRRSAGTALLGHDGADELPVLLLGSDEVTLGRLEGVCGLIEIFRIVHAPVGDLLLGPLHVGGQRRAGHRGGECATSPLWSRRADGLGRLPGSRGKAWELARDE